MKRMFATLAVTLLLAGAGCMDSSYSGSPSGGNNDSDANTPATSTSSTPGSGGTYQNTAAGFAVSYPAGVIVIDDTAAMATSGYIPACDPTTAVACFVIPQSAYAGKNFDSAGFAVNVLSDKKTQADCLAPGGNAKKTGTRSISGTAFTLFTDGDAAMSHRSDGVDALAFHNGICYELTTRTNTTVFEVYAPGTIQRFTVQDQAEVDAKLNGMMNGFAFMDTSAT